MNDYQYEYGVLFVDDEDQILKYFRRAFEGQFEIFSATNAGDGKAILESESNRIAILMTDQRMPAEKGVELLKFSRKAYPNIIRILTTGFTDLDDAIEAVNAGEIHRYITKPWDLNALQLELRQAMQFFQLRKERDELLREKLSAWQRLEGVNRAREIIAFAGGWTLTRNPSSAVKSFIEQIPLGDDSASPEAIASWEQLPGEAEKAYSAGRELVAAIEGKRGDSVSVVAIDALFESARSSSFSERLSIDFGGREISVEGDRPLLDWMLSWLLDWAASPERTGRVTVEAEETDRLLQLSINVERGTWNGASILDYPPELLGAYLVCHHHYGDLNIGLSGGDSLSIVASLCKRPSAEGEREADFSWLGEALVRFENW